MTTTHNNDQRDSATWPKQLVFPGQVAAPEGPISMHMMYVMHHAFRRDLAQFADAARETPVDDQATWRALATRWDRFSTLLHHHHQGEDAGIWPFLLERADAEERETLQAMEAEHELIDPLLTSCAAGFERLSVAVDVDAKATLEARTVEARDGLGQHLAHEETDAIAILQRHTTPEDWARIEEEHFSKQDDNKLIFFAVPWLAHQAPRGLIKQVLDLAGGPFKVLMFLTRPGFERRERRAFKHLAKVC